jgi:multicomponent Na+:H+ antiporter subunit G
MSAALDAVTVAAICAGAFFFAAGTAGLLRFPDPPTRLHALTKADNLGLFFIVLGLLPQADAGLAAAKLALVWLLAQLAGTAVSQLLARAALSSGRDA